MQQHAAAASVASAPAKYAIKGESGVFLRHLAGSVGSAAGNSAWVHDHGALLCFAFFFSVFPLVSVLSLTRTGLKSFKKNKK